MILGTFGSILANLTLDQWIKLAPAAIEFVSAAVKLGENIKPVIDRMAATHPWPGAAQAHQQWRSAWTEVDQRIYNQQNESRG